MSKAKDRRQAKLEHIAQRRVKELPEGFSFGENGLNYIDPYNDSASSIWICSKLEVTASTRDTNHENWGRVLEFRDNEGHFKKWVMPMEMLAGRGDLLHSTLLNMGLSLSTSAKAKNLLAQYIQACTGNEIAVCVNHIGWFNKCYVMPSQTIGYTEGKNILLQTANPSSLGFRESGTVNQWREEVASFAIGNSRIAFSISAAFTAPLLSLLGIEGGGFHFRGESSKGKTITLYAGGSVWGSHDRKKMWRATSNGLEMTAYQHNDSLLLLDEMGEMNPKEIGNTVYMLANGQAKQRMNELQPKQWRLLFLSTGEVDLKSAMAEAGVTTRAGQEVRLVDIEAVVDEYGVFDTLQEGFSCSRSQAEQLQAMTAKYYGTVGREFLEHFTRDIDKAVDRFKAFQSEFIEQVTPSGANSQVKRVLNRFAIVAAGGELASSFGLTGWDVGEASFSAKACFDSWLANLSSVKESQEEVQSIEQIRLFIERFGESRFSDLNRASDSHKPNVVDRVGYKHGDNEGKKDFTYYFFQESFKKEVCKGISYKLALNALKKRGYLKHEVDRSTHRIPRENESGNRPRLYAVRSAILEVD